MSTDAFRVERLGRCLVISMPGEIDITNSDQVGQALLGAIGQQPEFLVIDMTHTVFCDSTGVAALVDAHRQAATSETRLMLVAPGVERILRLTGFDEIVTMYPTLDAACAAAGPASQE